MAASEITVGELRRRCAPGYPPWAPSACRGHGDSRSPPGPTPSFARRADGRMGAVVASRVDGKRATGASARQARRARARRREAHEQRGRRDGRERHHENERIVREVDGQAIYWWERTPSADGSEGEASTLFNRVMTDSDAFNGATPPRQRAGRGHVRVSGILPLEMAQSTRTSQRGRSPLGRWAAKRFAVWIRRILAPSGPKTTSIPDSNWPEHGVHARHVAASSVSWLSLLA